MASAQIEGGALAEQLQQGIDRLEMTVGPDAKKKLLDYLALLVKWNKVYNLTAIRDPRQMVIQHLLDSLAIIPHINGERWLDVGSGAGLPGMVIAVIRPDWRVTLLDSNSKKTGFLQQVVIELGLSNVQIQCSRVEEFYAQDKYDGIVSRAFTELGDFLRITRHLIADHGRWFAMKGFPEQELTGVPDSCLVEKIIKLAVPGLDAARSLVIVKTRGAA